MTIETTAGRCAACGHPFTTAAHQRPRRRFCSERCRKSDWQRHRHTPQRHRTDDVARRLHDGDDRTHDGDDVVAPPRAPGASAPRCPHCARPIAVITLLVAPAAAQVSIPGADHG